MWGVGVSYEEVAVFKRKKSAAEVQRVCGRCGTESYAPKKGMFTRDLSGVEFSAGMSWTGTAALMAREKQCPKCGSRQFSEREAPAQ